MTKNIGNSITLPVLLALAACGGGDVSIEGEEAKGASGGTGASPAEGNAIRVTVTALTDDNYYGLEKCRVALSVANGTDDDVRSLSIDYRPRGSDIDEMVTKAGGTMLMYIKDIGSGATVEDESEIRGMACAGLTGIDVTAVRCQTESRHPCDDAVRLESAVAPLTVAHESSPAN